MNEDLVNSSRARISTTLPRPCSCVMPFTEVIFLPWRPCWKHSEARSKQAKQTLKILPRWLKSSQTVGVGSLFCYLQKFIHTPVCSANFESSWWAKHSVNPQVVVWDFWTINSFWKFLLMDLFKRKCFLQGKVTDGFWRLYPKWYWKWIRHPTMSSCLYSRSYFHWVWFTNRSKKAGKGVITSQCHQ